MGQVQVPSQETLQPKPKPTATGIDRTASVVTLNDIIGHDEVKNKLKQMVQLIQDCQKTKVPWRGGNGMLLLGGAGVGKTLTARALANDCGCSFHLISASSIGNNVRYESEKALRIKEAFDRARKNTPAILFIDEIDLLVESSSYVVAELLTQMDGFAIQSSESKIFVLAAANSQKELHPSLLRSGRLNPIVRLRLPNELEREKMFRKGMETLDLKEPKMDKIDLKHLVHVTSGFSGAEIITLCNDAIFNSILKSRDGDRKGWSVTDEDFESAIDDMTLGLKLIYQPSQEEQEITAYHEAGHVVALLRLPEISELLKVTILPHERSTGVVLTRWPEDKPRSLTHFENQIIVSYAGMEGVKTKFDKYYAGNSGDIANVQSVFNEIKANAMLPWVKGGQDHEHSSSLASGEKTSENLLGLSQKAASLMTSNRRLLDTLASALLTKKTLSHREVMEILKLNDSVLFVEE